jgi:hypothetical protein
MSTLNQRIGLFWASVPQLVALSTIQANAQTVRFDAALRIFCGLICFILHKHTIAVVPVNYNHQEIIIALLTSNGLH